ncbi:CerR family C-terminal domain-containing protein [Pseudohoeflea suaedae]|nr:CerR family C-terminal domain-containing protein [Pseudohoeflea suaedae]
MAKGAWNRDAGRAGEETRMELVSAATRLFGAKGFEATSTREIAAEANANIASIAYHFGGKDGLRMACAEMAAEQISRVIGEVVLKSDPQGDPEQALKIIETAIAAALGFLLGQDRARDLAAFILGEVARPGEVFERLYGQVFQPVHSRMCRLMGVATGRDPEDEIIRLGVFTIVGQVLYFRLGAHIVARRMEWETFGPDEIASIREVVVGNIRAFAAANKTGAGS